MRPIFAQGLTACLLSLCSLTVALADVIVLKSGDRITGEIQEIWELSYDCVTGLG